MKSFSARSFSVRHLGVIICLVTIALLAAEITGNWRAHAQGGNPVTTVSAASFEAAPVAPEAIVAAFGSSLATRVEVAGSVPLPTSLAGTTVKVKDSASVERLASLFFVAPSQVNYLIPAGAANGAATITITNGDGVVSTGTVQIARVAPGIFTANASGQGVAAAVALRVKADGSQTTEPVMRFDQAQNRFVTAPIDLGPAGEQVFLILFGTGIRGRGDFSAVTAKIGGVDAEVSFAGPQGGFVGLDQINVRLPRILAGRGRVNLAINIVNGGASNLCELEVAASQGALPPLVTSFGGGAVLASQSLSINGQGFAPNQSDNLVRIGGVEARVISASTTQLSVRVPFGAQSGPLSVRTPQGEWVSPNPLMMRTSVSGFIEDTNRQPLPGVVVRMIDTTITATTNAEGSFILPDVTAGNARDIEIDATRLPGSLPYPKLRLKLRVLANRDNQFPAPVALQQATGPSLSFGTNVLASRAMAKYSASPTQTGSRRIQTGGVIFEVPDGVGVSFPDGGTSGSLTLSIVENSRTPVNLPSGQFSQVISQVTPFGAVLLPGARLTFPNSDNYAPGTPVKLLRLDQTRTSSTLGSFVEAGVAVVTADGQRIETAPNAITEATIYFAANPRPTTTVTGRVLDSDGKTPVRQALVRSRGQEAFTDGNGGFVLRGVVVNPGDVISVEASFVRSNGRVDRTQRSGIAAVVGGITNVTPDLALPSEESNRPPVILAPTSLAINEGETRDILFVAGDPDPGQTIQLNVSGASFASISPRANDVYALRLQTRANDAGRYTLMLTATDNQSLSNRLEIRLTVNRPPVANAQSVLTDEDVPRAITLTGNDPDGDPLSYIIVSNPLRGVLSGTLPNLTYTPPPNYNGTDSFTFRVSDGFTESNVATVSIFVNPVNDRPVLAVPGSQAAQTGQNINFTVTATDVDADQTLTFTATGLPGGATLTQTSVTSARFSWTPNETQAGNFAVNCTVRDNGAPALSDAKTVTIAVISQWSPTAAIEGGSIFAMVSDGANLFAGTHGGGIFRSTDNGQSWTAANTGLTNLFVNALVSNGASLFAGTGAGNFVAPFGGAVFRSTDNGQSWTPVLANAFSYALAVSGTSVFVGINGNGIVRSIDNGQSWTPVNTGLPQFLTVRSFAVSGSNIFAGTQTDGVFLSTNNGQSWTAVNNGLPVNTTIRTLAVSGAKVFAGTDGGLFVSSNNGQSWTVIPAVPLRALASIVVGTNIFVGSDSGTYRSTDNGQSWTHADTGLGGEPLSFTVSGTTLFAGTFNGISLTTNNGQSWVQANTGLAAVGPIALSSSAAGLFAAVSGCPGCGGGGTIYRTGDNGQSWTNINATFQQLPAVYSFAVSNPNSFANLFAGAYGGVYLTTNNGQNWRGSIGLPQDAVSALAINGMDLFAGTGNNGVYRSTDNGQTWIPAKTGIGNLFIRAITVNGTMLFAGTDTNGIYRSTDNGQTWAAINAGLLNQSVYALTVDSGYIFAGTQGGVYRSNDNGNNWANASTGLPANTTVNAFLSGPSILAATNNGVFISPNRGQSWTAVSAGLPNAGIVSLAVNGTNLYAGTVGNGVYHSTY